VKFMVPKPITDAMIVSSTIAAPDVSRGETEWVSGGTYAVGALRTYTPARYVFECVQAHSGVTTTPDQDPTRWLKRELQPMNKFAAMDSYVSTKTLGPSPLTMVFRPGFMNTLIVFGAVGTRIYGEYRASPGGVLLRSIERPLYQGSTGWWNYYYGGYRPRTKFIWRNLPLRPDPELTLTITGSGEVGLGMVGFGSLTPLSTLLNYGTQLGARAEPITYSFFKYATDGTVVIVRRGSATNIRASVLLGDVDGDTALLQVQSILDTPTFIVATDAPRFDGLNGFGLISASLGYDGKKHRVMNIDQKGFI
jgi:hypothetical protein